jgi:hypothetical protein
MDVVLNAAIYSSAHGLRDKSEKPGEVLCIGSVPDLQRLARINADKYSSADSPNILFYHLYSATLQKFSRHLLFQD